MKRWIVLMSLLATGSLSLAVSAYQSPALDPAALRETKIEKVKENLYVITGSSDPKAFSGGNTAVFITDAGVVLVDTKFPGWGPRILELVKTVTSKPVVMVINTHSHNDHSGSNEFFAANVDSVVQENTRANMSRMAEFSGDKAKFLPRRTFGDRLTLGRGKDEMDLYYFGRGHTGGDALVVFPAIRVMHAGDLFAQKQLPLIDTMSGGNAVEYPQTLAKAAAAIKNVDTVIPGHRPVATWKEFEEYGSFMKDVVDFARASMKANRTAAEAAASFRIPAGYSGYAVTIDRELVNPEAIFQIVYDDLKKQDSGR